MGTGKIWDGQGTSIKKLVTPDSFVIPPSNFLLSPMYILLPSLSVICTWNKTNIKKRRGKNVLFFYSLQPKNIFWKANFWGEAGQGHCFCQALLNLQVSCSGLFCHTFLLLDAKLQWLCCAPVNTWWGNPHPRQRPAAGCVWIQHMCAHIDSAGEANERTRSLTKITEEEKTMKVMLLKVASEWLCVMS